MAHDTTIRRVYEWASKQRKPVTLYDIMDGLNIVKSTAWRAMISLQDAGFAKSRQISSQEAKRPENRADPQVLLWTISGTHDEVTATFCSDLDPSQIPKLPLKPYEQVRDVFEYAARCAAQDA